MGPTYTKFIILFGIRTIGLLIFISSTKPTVGTRRQGSTILLVERNMGFFHPQVGAMLINSSRRYSRLHVTNVAFGYHLTGDNSRFL